MNSACFLTWLLINVYDDVWLVRRGKTPPTVAYTGYLPTYRRQ